MASVDCAGDEATLLAIWVSEVALGCGCEEAALWVSLDSVDTMGADGEEALLPLTPVAVGAEDSC